MNNNSIPGWDFENDTCLTNQRKLIGPDQQELVELLWQNGQVVMQNQTHRKPLGNSSNMRVHVQKTDQSTLRSSGPYGNSTNLDQEEEAPSWIQFPLEDPLEHDCCSNLLSELPPYKPIRQLEEEKFANFFATTTSSSQPLPPNMKSSCVQGLQGNPILMPAPRFHVPDSSQKINDFVASRKVLNFPHFSTPLNNVSSAPGSTQFREKTTANLSQSEAREYSVITVGSSHCGSNHIPQEQDVSMVSSSGVWATTNNTTLSAEPEAVRDCVQRPICPRSDKDKGKSEMIEPTVTSSSGGSGSTGNGRNFSLSTRDHGRKRKATEEEASEEQSEATELKSADGNKASQRTGSSRRNRASEVHNQSERRRRDRINEKMRTLQQLIPNSNKTDKASMLEEAIEYLKSLQFQLQVMWMGAGMTHTPVLFPGIQHYMPQMGMGMGAASIHQLPKVTSHDQQAMPNHQNLMCQNSIMSTFNYQNHQCHIPEQYARYMGYHLMQTTSQHQAMNNNVLRYGSHSEAQGVQHSQTMIAAGNNSSGPMTGTANNNIDELVPVSAKAGSSTFNT